MMKVLQCIALCTRNQNVLEFLGYLYIVYEIKAFNCFFKSAQQQCNDLTWKYRVFRLLTALKSVVHVIEVYSLFCC
jgi:hypothetical protein